MNNWVNRLAMEMFSLIYDRMIQLLMQVEYQQCDETYFQVNKDGREAGTKSFMCYVLSFGERLKPLKSFMFKPFTLKLVT